MDTHITTSSSFDSSDTILPNLSLQKYTQLFSQETEETKQNLHEIANHPFLKPWVGMCHHKIKNLVVVANFRKGTPEHIKIGRKLIPDPVSNIPRYIPDLNKS